MLLHGEIVPRADASPDQFKSLGAGLRRWFHAWLDEFTQAGQDVDGWVNDDALADLEAGELPQPTLLRFLGGQPGLKAEDVRDSLERVRAAFPLVRRAVPRPDVRSVAFGLTLVAGAEPRDCLLGSLRRHLSAECQAVIADVVVDGNSIAWKEGGS
jgi:hypothetical protein